MLFCCIILRNPIIPKGKIENPKGKIGFHEKFRENSAVEEPIPTILDEVVDEEGSDVAWLHKASPHFKG